MEEKREFITKKTVIKVKTSCCKTIRSQQPVLSLILYLKKFLPAEKMLLKTVFRAFISDR